MMAERFWNHTNPSCDAWKSFMAQTTVGQYVFGLAPEKLHLSSAIRSWILAETRSMAAPIVLVAFGLVLILVVSRWLAMEDRRKVCDEKADTDEEEKTIVTKTPSVQINDIPFIIKDPPAVVRHRQRLRIGERIRAWIRRPKRRGPTVSLTSSDSKRICPAPVP